VLVEVVCICTQNSPLSCGEGDLTASMQATVRQLPSHHPAPPLSLSPSLPLSLPPSLSLFLRTRLHDKEKKDSSTQSRSMLERINACRW
jgi:hypothetical protein